MSELTSVVQDDFSVELGLAFDAHEQGNLEKADQLYRGILQSDPLHLKANYNLGILHIQQGNPARAQRHFQQALKLAPENETCWQLCSEVALQLGQLAVACVLLERTTRHFGTEPAWYAALAQRLDDLAERVHQLAIQGALNEPAPEDIELLGELGEQGQYALLERAAQLLARCLPAHPFGWKALGVALEGKGDKQAALAPMQKALELDPLDAEGHFNLGNIFKGLFRFDEAEVCYREALELEPGLLAAQLNLAGLLVETEREAEAEAIYQQTLQLHHDNAETATALGICMFRQGRTEEARQLFMQALSSRPDHFKALCNLGIVYFSEGSHAQAEECFARAISDRPDIARAYGDIGTILLQAKRFDEAEKMLQKAIELDPEFPEAYCNLGTLYGSNRKFVEAERCYRRALEISPNYVMALGNLASMLKDIGGGIEGISILNKLSAASEEELWIHSNLLFAMTHESSINPQELYEAHREFGMRLERRFEAAIDHQNTPNPTRPLRLGFVSGDLRSHPVALFIEPVWAALDKQDFEIYAYHTYAHEDEHSRILRSHVKSWRNVSTLNDVALTEQIQMDSIDILFDLSGHTAGNRLAVFARKPAPIQISWIGYPATTGTKAIDYYLVDRHWAPPGLLDSQFVEKLVYLPAAFTFEPCGKTAIKAPPALFGNPFTFASFNRVSKLTDRTISLWSRVLHAAPESRLLLGGVENSAIEERLLERFADCGIATERLTFRPRVPFKQYQTLHNEVDLLLDCVPYTGGTTTNHALWMGVPTLTLAGETLQGRQGVAIMSHVGLLEFIANTETEFVEKAVFWTTQLPELTVIRAGLRSRINNSELRSAAYVARGLEKAIREMWQRWCRKEQPTALLVD